MTTGKIVFFDVRFGASGDMLLASLIDAGLSIDTLISVLSSIPLHGWKIEAKKIVRNHFSGTQLFVSCSDEASERTLSQIVVMLEKSSLSQRAKHNAINTFNTLARAESIAHGISPEEVHFHEIGAADSIIDIAGFCAAMELLCIEKILYNEIPLSRGCIATRHGQIPLPSPAVTELAQGARVVLTEYEGELITPTAVALLRTLGTQTFADMTSATLLFTGRGFGTRENEFPSFTRAFILEENIAEGDLLVEITCAIDDMNPQLFPHLLEKLFAEGALDAYLTPLLMKKGRPGFLLTALSTPDKEESMKQIIFRETTTIGVRLQNIWREKLSRSTEEIQLEGFSVRIKISRYRDEIMNVRPEYEDIKKIADATGKPIKELMEKAVAEYRR